MNGHLFLCSNAYTKTRSRLLYFIQHIHNCHFNIKSTRKFLMRYFCIHVVFEIGCVSLTAHLSSDWPHFKCSVATCGWCLLDSTGAEHTSFSAFERANLILVCGPFALTFRDERSPSLIIFTYLWLLPACSDLSSRSPHLGSRLYHPIWNIPAPWHTTAMKSSQSSLFMDPIVG